MTVCWLIDVRRIVESAKLLNSGGNGMLDLVFFRNIALECQTLGEKTQCK